MPMKLFDYSTLPDAEPAALEELVDEGMMLAEFAARLALKNQIVIRALTDPEPYDPEHYADLARSVLSERARESEGSAALAGAARKAAAGREGLGDHHHDYRDGDYANLRRRENTHAAVADRLSSRMNDADYLAAFVERARDDAWADVSGAITARLDREWVAPVLDAAGRRERDRRMHQLRREVSQLVREHHRAG